MLHVCLYQHHTGVLTVVVLTSLHCQEPASDLITAIVITPTSALFLLMQESNIVVAVVVDKLTSSSYNVTVSP